ncbi:hypothetical protein [Vibrio vulnificus]|uniref:hypothetical protein n=1 Tax=Vibrio vulnificus TaxID=672 RepID=UPI00092BC2C3|nr:hypothetical protein VFL11327_01741 [Vibrio fluvialis]
MAKIKRLLGQKWLISLIGLGAISIFIWFVGPLIAIAGIEPLKSDFNRLLVIHMARPQSRKDNIVMIDLKGNKVQLELIPKSTMNPFWSSDMESFRCPQTL